MVVAQCFGQNDLLIAHRAACQTCPVG
jgi:hypothetical protein